MAVPESLSQYVFFEINRRAHVVVVNRQLVTDSHKIYNAVMCQTHREHNLPEQTKRNGPPPTTCR